MWLVGLFSQVLSYSDHIATIIYEIHTATYFSLYLSLLGNHSLYFTSFGQLALILPFSNFSSPSYSQLLCGRSKKKKKKVQVTKPSFPEFPNAVKQPGVYWPSHLNLVYLVILVTRRATFPNRNYILVRGPIKPWI